MAMMTITPWFMEFRGDCKAHPDPTVRHIPSTGGRYAPESGPDAGGGRG